MRNVKKFLALVLAMLMVVSAAATVSAFEDVADDHAFAAAINDLTVKEIVNGYDGETFGPDDAVTRQQMALMMARAITGNVGDDAVWAQGGLVGFEDVTEYQYAIATVVKAGIVDGFLDNTFRPEEGITFVQALKMAVAALGYDDGNLEWWQGYYNVALDLGLTEKLNYITDADKALNRGEVAQLIYNMLYVELADGSDCYASQNFGLATPENVTTFIITATDKQTAAQGMDVTEGGFVGVQKLVNGVPDGDVYYVANEAFGFEGNEDEDAFLSAYGFVNWDNGDFDQIIPVGDSWKVYNTEITEASSKFAYDGKNYYLVDELTGTAIKNEVVIYNATDYGYTATNKQLFLNKEGQVLDPETGVAILEAVYAVNGDIVSYRALRTDKDGVVKGDYLSIAAATEKYGVAIGEIVVPFETMVVGDLKGAYELTVFDDDMDGKMDRAYYNPVYVSAHETNLNSSKLRYGPMAAAAKTGTTFVDVDGESVTLADGQVYKYTYNKQLNVVTVLGTYDVQTGTINRISTLYDYKNSSNQSENHYAAKITIDGVTYTMGNLNREVMGIDGFTIYNHDAGITQVANIKGKTNAGGDYAGVIGSGHSTIGYTYENKAAFESLDVKDLVRFVAVEDTILVIEAFDIEEAYDLVVLEEAVDFDTEAVYLDLWMDGELVEDVAVTRIWDVNTNKYVDVADLNYFKLNALLTQVFNADPGYIYRAVPTADGYQISVAFTNAKADRVGSANASATAKLATNKFGLAYLTPYAKGDALVFEDGIGDTYKANTVDVLRTKSTTLFYFINKTTNDVYVYTGKPADGAKIMNLGDDDANVQVYANKLGFTSDISGIAGQADTVVVYYNNKTELKGFGVTDIGEKVVYVSAYNYADWYQHNALMEPYDYGYASDFGLGRDYDGDIYYYYNKQIAIDMHTGAYVSEIYVADAYLKAGAYYVLSADNVVVAELTAVKNAKDVVVGYTGEGFTVTSATAKDNAIKDGRNWTSAFFTTGEIDTVYMIDGDSNFANSTRKASVSDFNGLLDDTNGNTIWYLTGDEDDGIFVAVVGDAVVPAPGATEVKTNGTWNLEGYAPYNADATVTVTDGILTATINTCDVTVASGEKVTDQTTLWKGSEKTDAVDTIAIQKFNTESGKYEWLYYDGSKVAVSVDASYKDGVVTVSKVYYTNESDIAVEFGAGTYKLNLRIADVADASGNGTYELVVNNIKFVVEEAAE